MYGSIGSFFDLLGGVLICAAFASGAPMGPSSALLCIQPILLVIVKSIMNEKVPSYLQIVGLILGVFGVLMLTIPEYLIKLYYRIKCFKQKDAKEATTAEDALSSK